MTAPVLIQTRPRRSVSAAILAPVGFLVAYLAVGPVSGAFADRALPLPGSPTADVVAYFSANPLAAGSIAVLQAVSVACFAIFVAWLAPASRMAGAGWLSWVGSFAVAAMGVSLAAWVALMVIAGTASDVVIETLRSVNFYSGGVVHIVSLGVFVIGSAVALGRTRAIGQPTRWFGFVAGGISVLSLLSLAIYYASAALPIGRVLSMVWTVGAGIVVFRRVRTENR
jgi:hypothetical protein